MVAMLMQFALAVDMTVGPDKTSGYVLNCGRMAFGTLVQPRSHSRGLIWSSSTCVLLAYRNVCNAHAVRPRRGVIDLLLFMYGSSPSRRQVAYR